MKRHSLLTITAFFVFGLIALSLTFGSRAEAQMSGSSLLGRGANGNPGVLPPNSKAFGKSYGEWSAEFQQWLYSLPTDRHPLFDTAACSEGQSGKAWFLGGTFEIIQEGNVAVGVANRACSIPQGKALFFPIINGECNTFTDDGLAGLDELRACAKFLADHIQNLQVSIDGRNLNKLNHYRVESPLFTFGPLPDGNVLEAPAGETHDSVVDGYFIMVAPLSTGKHTIYFSGEAAFTEEADGFDFLFQLDITYNITVE